MEKLPGELMIFGFLSPTLVTTYDTILYDTPFEEQFRLIEGLSSCQDVRKQWRSIADENPALFSREYCITAASKELMSRGPHIKRLVVLLPPDKTNASDDPSAGDDPSASDNFPSAGSAIPAETKSIKPILEGLAVRPQLAYIHWDCRHPFTPPLRSDYPRLQNLTRLDWYFTLDTISSVCGSSQILADPGIHHHHRVHYEVRLSADRDLHSSGIRHNYRDLLPGPSS